MKLLASQIVWIAAYFALAGVDFWHFLYAHRLSPSLTGALFLLIAVGWNWWFRRLGKENEVVKLGLGAPAKSNHG